MKQNYELGIVLRDAEVRTISKCFDSLLNFASVSPINGRDN